MFDLVQRKAMAANFVNEAVKKPGELFDGALKAKLDHSMNHHGIVDVDPESEALLPAFERGEIEFFQFACKILVALENI